jgi:phosphoglucomutase
MKVARIMELFRSDVTSEFAGLNITDKTDLKKNPGEYPVSNVLGFHFDEGTHLWVRPSGTEPKIKFYLLVNATDGSLDEKKAAAQTKTQNLLNLIDQYADKA